MVLLPALWSGGVYYQGAPITATWRLEGPDLALSISGTIATLLISSDVRISPPAEDRIAAQVTTLVEGSVDLDDRPGEAFKPVMLSSMHVSPTAWDAQQAYADCCFFPIPEDGWWIVEPPVVAKVFGLRGGTSAWKTNAPTIEVVLDRPMQVTGWVTRSDDPNGDNIGF